VTASNTAGSASASSAASAVVTASSTCTDTWTGAAGNYWQTPGNWSTGEVPTSSDEVCIPSGSTVYVNGGANRAGSISGEGALVISGGSLELANAARTSSIGSLSLSHATLSGAGTLDVTSSFTFGPDGTMSGSGSTVVGSGVTGEVHAASGCEPMNLSGGRVFVNEGTLTFVWGTLIMSEGARFENEGTFADDSEASCYGKQILGSGGAAPAVSNTGVFEKSSASGTSTVAVSFSNQGSVIAKTGTLAFSGGGIPEEVATGSWAVQGSGSIVLSGGTFLIGEEVDLSAVHIQGATVTRVPIAPPSSTSAPGISGELFSGQTLSASTGTWSGTPPITYTYQWQSCNSSGGECANITGATSQTYTLGGGDVGRTVRVLVSAHNSHGSATESSPATAVVAAPVPPANTTPPEISGTTRDGQTLSASTGAWTGAPAPTFSYQWTRCDSAGAACADIPGAIESTYVLGHEDVGSTLRVRVQASNFAGSASSTSGATGVVAPLAPANTAPPVIAGTPQAGQTLTAEVGSWEGTPPLTYTYQWESCNSLGLSCMAIPGATHATYEPGAGEVGGTLQVMVTATNSVGSASSFSAVSAVILPAAPTNMVPPVISGTAQAGQTLSANTGSWEGAPPITYAYQWQGCNSAGEGCVDIPGANSPTYTPGHSEVGSTLAVIVTAMNPGGSTLSFSEPTDMVTAAPGESACTDTWVGPQDGQWLQAGSWSTGSVPGPGDVACAGSWVTIQMPSASNRVGALYAGALALTGGSLELTDAAHASSVHALTLNNATLTGAGSLEVSGSFAWGAYGAMSGSGSTVIGPAVTGTVEASSGCEPLSLTGRTLVNEGTLTFVWGTLYMSEGALLENKGTFSDNSEASCYGQQIRLPEGGASAPVGIANTGTFEKSAGTGTGTVAVPFGDEGAVTVQSGQLRFTDGGLSQVAAGSWSTQGSGSIVLGGGSFLIGEEVDLSAVRVEGATVTRVPVSAPSSSSPPAVSGQAVLGQTLSVSNGSWSGTRPLHYAYQWQRCNSSGEECANITGATSQGYTLAEADLGSTLRALVTASNGGGSASATSAASAVVVAGTAPSNTALPAITGTPEDGQTLAVSTGSWSGASPITYSYQWESCNPSGAECAQVEGATGGRYRLGEGDVNTTLRVVVTATNSLGSVKATSPTTAVVQSEPVSEIQAPSISGTPDASHVLSASQGSWAGTAPEIRYQWESCNSSGSECAPIEGATEPEYDLGEGDVGTTLRVRVGAGNSLDSLTDTSAVTPVIGATSALANTSAPSIEGTPQNGQTLTASQGSWTNNTGAVSYAYQWQSCDPEGRGCEAITGATASTYTLGAANVGRTLRVLVSATDERGSRSEVSPATQPVAETHAPVPTQPPAISGTALQGHTLAASTGGWSKEGPTVYSYQWERCGQSGPCAAIEGATASTYTPTAGDVGSTIVVLVSASDTGGSSTGASNPTAPIGPETIVKYSNPSISGVLQLAGTLTADPGIWSASGPLTYAYQWEACHTGGTECAPIEGATEPTYTPVQSNVGSTLRVKVTLTNPLGSTSAFSATTGPTPNGEVTEAQAQEIAQQTDPSLLAPSTTASLEGQSIAPALSDGEEGLSATGALTSSSISKEVPGEFAVNTPEGEISLTPMETSPNATTTPTIVNGAAAFFANTWPATDTIVRPDPLGATALLQLRSAEAPTSFSWEVGLGADQELRQLPGGAIAVVDPTEAQPESSGEGESGSGGEGTEGEPESQSESEAEVPELPEHLEEEVGLESLPAAPLSSTLPGEGGPGQPQPQSTQANYASATSAVASAEAQTADNTLMVIEPPTVTDANGNAVPASLSATANTVTLTVKPSQSATYPVLIDPTVAAASDKTSKARAPKFRYGLSDEQPHNLEHSGVAPETFNNIDPNLKSQLHIGTARLIVRYNILTDSHLEQEEKQRQQQEVKEGKEFRLTEMERLVGWLRAVQHDHLEPYITLVTDRFCDPKKEKAEKKKCPEPTVAQYATAITPLLHDLILGAPKGSPLIGLPQVKVWGAWNEPDLVTPIQANPLFGDAARAAQFWEKMQAIVTGAHTLHCRSCKVVAGEFAEDHDREPKKNPYHRHYIETYRNTLLHRANTNPTRYIPWPEKPRVWALHDYHDVVYHDVAHGGGYHDAKEFVKLADTKRLSNPFVWLSEQGVELQNNATETRLEDRNASAETDEARQRTAAFDFLQLAKGLPHLERVNYYSYSQPSQGEVAAAPHHFDSGLITNQDNSREAYCVLAYAKHICPPAVATGPSFSAIGGASGGGAVCSNQTVKVTWKGEVNPNGSTTKYHFEYGTTIGYGHTTPMKTLPKGRGVAAVSETENVSTGGPHEGGCATIHFRLVAENAGGTSDGKDSELTFTTLVG